MITYKAPFLHRLAGFLPTTAPENTRLKDLPFTSSLYRKGMEIFALGSSSTLVVAIGEGVAMRYRILPNGDRQIIMFLMPGDLCTPHIYPGAIDHFIEAVTDVRVDRFAPQTLIQLAMEDPGINAALWLLSEQQNAMMRDHIVSMGRHHARLRVLLVLADIVRRLPPGANGPIVVPMTQVQLADHAGMTHIHFNRVVGELARQGIVQTSRGGILIKNSDTLRAAVHT